MLRFIKNKGFAFVPIFLFMIYAELSTNFVSGYKGVDIKKHLEVFDLMKDSGAAYTIELLVDIPGKYDNNYRIRFRDGYPGHCFLKLTKQNTDTCVSRTFGFYPFHGWKTAIYKGPVRSRFEDDEGHAVDASMVAVIPGNNFKKVISWIAEKGSEALYDIDILTVLILLFLCLI